MLKKNIRFIQWQQMMIENLNKIINISKNIKNWEKLYELVFFFLILNVSSIANANSNRYCNITNNMTSVLVKVSMVNQLI